MAWEEIVNTRPLNSELEDMRGVKVTTSSFVLSRRAWIEMGSPAFIRIQIDRDLKRLGFVPMKHAQQDGHHAYKCTTEGRQVTVNIPSALRDRATGWSILETGVFPLVPDHAHLGFERWFFAYKLKPEEQTQVESVEQTDVPYIDSDMALGRIAEIGREG